MNGIKPELSAKLFQSARASMEMMAVVLPSFWSMIQLHAWWKPPANSIVFAVVLGVMLPRAMKPVTLHGFHYAIAAFGLGTAAAIGCGMLIAHDTSLPRLLGAVLFASGVALPVWVRRLGEVWKTSGTLFTIPFMAILVHPLPLDPSLKFVCWELVAAVIALIWASIAQALKNGPDRASAPESEPPATVVKRPGLAASTKMAIQLAVAVVVAFAGAELIDADHLVWYVLTVLIVHSGNRGRGDLLWKGGLRTVGALIGVAIASIVATQSSYGSMAVVAIFAILVFAAAAREFGYLLWAICIPAALVFLYSFFGQSGDELTTQLAHRLLGIAIGSAVGIASGYFIFPIRMVDVVRLRLNAMLSIASDFIISAAHGKKDEISLARLALVDNELSHFNGVAKAARYLGLGAARRLHGAITGARQLANTLIGGSIPQDATELAALAKEIGNARRSLAFQVADADLPMLDPANPFAPYINAIIAANLSAKAKLKSG